MLTCSEEVWPPSDADVEGTLQATWWEEPVGPCPACWKQRGGTGSRNIKGRPSCSVGKKLLEVIDTSSLLLEASTRENCCCPRELPGSLYALNVEKLLSLPLAVYPEEIEDDPWIQYFGTFTSG
ncbi:unnamed protein product [Caretta caretta]